MIVAIIWVARDAAEPNESDYEQDDRGAERDDLYGYPQDVHPTRVEKHLPRIRAGTTPVRGARW